MRGPTAFFLFSEEQREQTRAECVAAAEPGAKISVAVVAKAIGEKWRALSDEEKAEYQGKAAQRAKELAEAAAAADADIEAAGEVEENGGGSSPGKEGEEKTEQDANANPNPFGFPLSLIKRVMCLDPEVVRISGDGLKAVAKAAELMVADLAAKSCAVAQGQKRRTIKLYDVEQTVRRDRRLVDVGLKDILAEDMFKESKAPLRDAANKSNTAAGTDQAGKDGPPAAEKEQPGRKKAKETVDVGRPITDFFSR